MYLFPKIYKKVVEKRIELVFIPLLQKINNYVYYLFSAKSKARENINVTQNHTHYYLL